MLTAAGEERAQVREIKIDKYGANLLCLYRVCFVCTGCVLLYRVCFVVPGVFCLYRCVLFHPRNALTEITVTALTEHTYITGKVTNFMVWTHS